MGRSGERWRGRRRPRLFATGRTDGAIAALERSLQLDPSYVHGYLMLGMMLATMGKPEQAIENVEAAMRLSPKDPFLHLFLLAMSLAHAAAERPGRERGQTRAAREYKGVVVTRTALHWPRFRPGAPCT